MIRIFLAAALAAACLPAQTALEVVAAYYGADRHFFEVTDSVRQQAQADSFTLLVGADALGGDPMPGVIKTLRVYYKWNNRFEFSEAKDGETITVGRAALTGNRGTGRDNDRNTRRTPTLTIVTAVYGANGRGLDASGLLQSLVRDNRLEFQAGSSTLADPAPGVVKELVVTYNWQGQTREARVRDGEWLRLPPTTAGGPAAPQALPGLRLISATYGVIGRTSDVLGLLQSRVANDRLLVSADNNTLGGDPARGADKYLNVTYEYRGQRYTAAAKEGQMLRLPPDQLPAPVAASTGTAATTTSTAVPADSACFYPYANYQGTPTCFSQDQTRLAGKWGSVKLQGRVRSFDLFENNAYGGRTLRLIGDQPDLSTVSAGGGGFFGNTTQYTWVAQAGSLRLLAQ